MATLDSSIVNIALPSLTKAFGADLHLLKWVVVIYLLCITCLLLPFGRLADRFGRKEVFQAGFLVFTLASLACGFSGGFWGLLIARMIQGAGAALLMANGPALIAHSFPTGERGRALGLLAMVVSGGLISGPSIGGFLIHSLGWESIFWVNAPVGVLGFILTKYFVPPEKKHFPPAPFDWLGALLQGLLIVSFILFVDPPALSLGAEVILPHARIVAAALTLGFLFLFIFVERRTRAPLFELALLKIPSFGLGNLASYLTFVAFSAMTVLMPFFLEEVLRFSTRRTGIAMSMIPLTIFLVAPISGRLSDRIGTQGLAIAGGVIGTIAFLGMAGMIGPGLNQDSTVIQVGLSMVLVGLATGLFQSPNNSAIMGSVPHGKLGVASALLATIRNLGIATGTGMAAGVFSMHFSRFGDYVSALHFVLYMSATIALSATVVSCVKRKRVNLGLSAQTQGAQVAPDRVESEESEDDDIPVDFESQEPITVKHAPVSLHENQKTPQSSSKD
jgi:EmrB/QacA subfamily drug resistance transporter